MVQAVAMRWMAVRALAGVFAVSWLVFPGFGVIDLSVTWRADWPQVLEAGWGLFATVIVGVVFVRVAWRPRACAPAAAQLVVASFSLAVSAIVAKEAGLFALVILLALQTAIVLAGSWPQAPGSWAVQSGVSRSLLLVAAAGVAPGSPTRCRCGR